MRSASFLVAWVVAANATLAQFSPFLLQPSDGGQHDPEVAGTLVIWSEVVDGRFAVRGRDLVTGATFLISDPSTSTSGPAIDGRMLVWGDKKEGNWNVLARDLLTGEEWTVVDEPHSQGRADVDGSLVVWSDSRSSPEGVPPEFSNRDVYAKDLRNGKEFPVCTFGSDQTNPVVSGNIIVWQDHRFMIPGFYPKWGRIYGYDVTTGREFLIAASEDGTDQVSPAISGNIVVWQDLHNGGDIWGHDLDANSSFPIHVGPYGQGDPDTDGRYVVWEDWRNGTDRDIWGYDLLTGEEFPVFLGPGDQASPAVSSNLVVWDGDIPGEPSRVWATYIPEPSTGLLLLAAVLCPLCRRSGRSAAASP